MWTEREYRCWHFLLMASIFSKKQGRGYLQRVKTERGMYAVILGAGPCLWSLERKEPVRLPSVQAHWAGDRQGVGLAALHPFLPLEWALL